MSWGLWNTLLRPDMEELQNSDKTAVSRAANFLQIGEFQLLQLAYCEWYGKDLPTDRVDELFQNYMINGDVPHWARHFSRHILSLSEKGRIDENADHYHRYDHEYHSSVPNGLGKFIFAASCLIVFLGGSIFLADATTKEAVSIFPPYFETENPETPTSTFDGFGRADAFQPRPGR